MGHSTKNRLSGLNNNFENLFSRTFIIHISNFSFQINLVSNFINIYSCFFVFDEFDDKTHLSGFKCRVEKIVHS